MADSDERARNKGESASPNTKGNAPQHQGGDAARKAQQWGGGNKASKGPMTKADRQNQTQAQRVDRWSRPLQPQSQASELASMVAIEVGITQKVPTREVGLVAKRRARTPSEGPAKLIADEFRFPTAFALVREDPTSCLSPRRALTSDHSLGLNGAWFDCGFDLVFLS